MVSTFRRSILWYAPLCAGAAVYVTACGANDPVDPSNGGGTGGSLGNGGSGQGGAGRGGSTGTGGATTNGGATGTGGASGSGMGGSSPGGTSATGGNAGSPIAGGSGSPAGGDAGAAPMGGAGMMRGGRSGRGGMAGASTSGGAGGESAGASGTGGTAGTGGTGGAGPTGMSAGCGKAPGIASSMYNNGSPIAITVGGTARRYILNVPTNYDQNKPYKLVIAFHQLNGNDVQMYKNKYYHLLDLAANTAIFVAPNGQKSGAPCTGTGTGESGCGWPNPSSQDTALSDAVVAQIEENFCVDTNRIFANGWSFGGAMSYETACARPLGASGGYLRAVAVYSGSPQITQGPCPPSKPVAYYASHGTDDSVLQYSGGVTMAQDFAKTNGCTWATPTQATGDHVCTNLTGCTEGYPVEFCSFVGPHTPDPSDGGGMSWEYQNVWTFFSQF